MPDRKRVMARVDWGQAKAFYIASPPEDRSLAAVAVEFRVSQRAVQLHAVKERWREAAAKADAKAAQRAEEFAVKTREERVRQDRELIDLAKTQAIQKLRAGELEVRLSDLPPLLKHELLLDGQATEVVAVAEVQQRITLIVQTILPMVPAERRPAAIEALRSIRGISEGEAA